MELVNYLGELSIYFTKFSGDEEVDLPIFNSQKKLKVFKDFKKLLEKMYPNEMDFLEYRKKQLADDVKKEQHMKKLLKGKKSAARDLFLVGREN